MGSNLSDLKNWISKETIGAKCVVEFGAGFFEKLAHVRASRLIGIEAHRAFIDNAVFHDCQKVEGNFLNFEGLLSEEDMDVAMFIDSLEHVTREEAFDLIRRVQKKFRKIILFIPEGEHHSDHDPYGLGGDYWETHRSTWYESDIRELGFENIRIDSDFHSLRNKKELYKKYDTGAIYAVWERDGNA